MKLAYSPASPYVRKVTACAIKRGIDKQDRADEDRHDRSGALEVQSAVQGADADHRRWLPALRQPGDLRVSRQRSARAQALPGAGPARWKALTQEALGDGILDATQPRRREIALPQDEGRKGYIELQQGKVKPPSPSSRRRPPRSATSTTIGEITIGCALGYLDFRYANEPWRPGHPKLDAWYAKVVKLPPLAETMPVG